MQRRSFLAAVSGLFAAPKSMLQSRKPAETTIVHRDRFGNAIVTCYGNQILSEGFVVGTGNAEGRL